MIYGLKSRKQGRNEPTVIFIACMEALFSRLSHHPAESTKIKFIKLGLQSEYQKRLALSDIDTIETLSKLCKKLEEADVLSLASTSSHSKVYSLESDLAYISQDSLSEGKNNNSQSKNNIRFSTNKNDSKNINNRSYNYSNKKHPHYNFKPSKGKIDEKPNSSKDHGKDNPAVNAVEFNPSSQKTDRIICWKCGLQNHTFRSCLSDSKKEFCFKCGQQNVTVKECQRCAGNY